MKLLFVCVPQFVNLCTRGMCHYVYRLPIVPCGLKHVTNVTSSKRMNLQMEEIFAPWEIEKTQKLKDTNATPHFALQMKRKHFKAQGGRVGGMSNEVF